MPRLLPSLDQQASVDVEAFAPNVNRVTVEDLTWILANIVRREGLGFGMVVYGLRVSGLVTTKGGRA